MTQVITQIGNSEGVAIPREIREKSGLKKGVKVNIELTHDKRVVISKVGKTRQATSITPEFLEIVKGINKRYGPALKKMAKI